MVRRVRDHDWAATPLGPAEAWTPERRCVVELVLASGLPTIALLGRDLIQVYNDGYGDLMGNKHPAGLGQATRDCWPEVWHINEPIYERVRRGETVTFEDALYPLSRSGVVQDVWLTLSYSPLRDGEGRVDGVLVVLFETTARHLAEERRQQAERHLRESEARHRLLIESVAHAVWQTDAGGVVTEDSPSWRRYTGQTLDEWLGCGWLDALHADDRAFAEQQWREAVASRGLVDAEFRLRAPDGRWRWTNVRAAPVLDAQGRVEKWVGMNIDIDDRKRAEAALVKSEKKFATLFAASPVPVLIALPDAPRFTIIEVNEAYLAATAQRRDEVAGRGMFETLPGHPDGPLSVALQGQRASLDRVLASHQPQALVAATADLPGAKSFAEARWWSLVHSPVLDAQGRVEAIIHSAIDVTAERRTSDALRQRGERQAFLLNLSDVLRSQPDAQSTAQTAVDMLAAHMALDRCFIATMSSTAGSGWVGPEFRRPGLAPMAGEHRYLAAPEVVRRMQEAVVVVADTSTEASFADAERANFLAVGIGSLLCVPLRRGDAGVIWTLSVATVGPRHWTDAERVLVEEVAERIWSAIERARVGTALRNSEALLRQFGEASSDVLGIRNAQTLRWEYLSPAFETVYGVRCDEALASADLSDWAALIVDEDRDRTLANIERVRKGEVLTFEYRVLRPSDGEVRWLRSNDFPMRGADGEVERIGGVGQDVTELKRVEAALHAQELRQRTLMDGIPQLVWRSLDEGRWTWSSPQWQQFTGQTHDDSHALGWLDVVHPEDRPTIVQAWQMARQRGMLDAEFRVRRAADGAYLWHHTRSVPVRDKDGHIVEWLGTTTDVQQLKEMQKRQAVLVAELQHRTRNLMGVVLSLSDKTVRSSADLPDFLGRFRDRLEALARVQGLLSRLTDVDRVAFDDLVRTELSAMGSVDRVTLDGPLGVRLRSSTVQTLAMALHELATNAVKYGALGQPQARLAITWRLEPAGPRGKPWLHVDWRESGVACRHPARPRAAPDRDAS